MPNFHKLEVRHLATVEIESDTERRGFEPPLGVTLKLISSQPPSTTRTPLQVSHHILYTIIVLNI